ncbi:hypothetical protein [Desulfomonile tiedjei]|uniref:Uncharacterized protein n=1 Tax=Desulfomonile tiedjei (strain ATCC 49306 / DSM 6799 / DCB-1) TaxID=706587 RepID=I4C7M9_DESTA|nr:hypothetical protein [Desulfomonile tiedjei]AFM25570.1 hypothetical protein Desti_2901 [Desulfomonile tiedjei DSM 6799]
MEKGQQPLQSSLEDIILDRVNGPGWVATRGVVKDPRSAEASEIEEAEQAMRNLAKRGLVRLWRLTVEHDGSKMMAAARLDLELDKDLEERGAWARAEPYE